MTQKLSPLYADAYEANARALELHGQRRQRSIQIPDKRHAVEVFE